MAYFAHSADPWGRRHLLADHLATVSRLAGEFSAGRPWSKEAALAGLLHDLGKYGDKFQARLRSEESGIDHWSMGAWVALQKSCASVAAAMSAQGHHIGLQHLSKDALKSLNPDWLTQAHPLGLRLSESDTGCLLGRLNDDGLQLSRPAEPLLPAIPGEKHLSWMLDLRLLFSALVDADFLDTEAHFESDAAGKSYRAAGPSLDPDQALEALDRYRALVRKDSGAEQQVARLRNDLWAICLTAAAKPPGLFTLAAPTGSGKTLAMLAFALDHARRHRLRRIVVVIPYLSIIEQTVDVYRAAFGGMFPRSFVLEDHSLVGPPQGTETEDSDRYWERLLAENWDAPIVVTTSVQFLESLFANRPSACRKLHRLAESVVLFDEVQTLPLALAVPTLAALSHLSSRCGSTIVFATATQPAFDHLDKHVRYWAAEGWNPCDIVPPEPSLFGRVRRVKVTWPTALMPTSWDQLCLDVGNQSQALVIVNVRRHARELARRLHERFRECVFHLSTTMCPAHRHAVLAEVRQRLKNDERCLLVSTQCIEAGVDVDFPTVYRAFGPLEAVAQAAGRCNREGRLEVGSLVVFVPEEEIYPDRSYERATSVARSLLNELGASAADIEDPDLYRRYYRKLYDLAQPGGLRPELQDAMLNFDFPEVARRYRVIPQDSMSVLVPYGENLAEYDALVAEVHERGLTADWMRRAQHLTVSLLRPSRDDLIWQGMAALPLRRGGCSDQWFVYLRRNDYDALTGLAPPKAPPVWLV